MRENKTNIRTIGKLFLNNKPFKENAELEFEDDYYSNDNNTGRIKIDYLSADFLNSFSGNKYKFKFIDSSNRAYIGRISGFQNSSEFNSRSEYLLFRLDEYKQHLRFADFQISSLVITFKIPFSYLLSRYIKSSFGFDDDYIIKFRKPAFKIITDKITLIFDEYVYFPAHKKPDDLMCRDIIPTIKIPFKSRKRFIPTLNEFEKYMDDVMLMISFVFYHKMDWYGYRADLWDKKDKMHEFLKYKVYNKNFGDNYLFEDIHGDFGKHFTEEMLSTLILKFRQRKVTEKNKLKHFINELISIKPKNSYKSRFIEALFLIESICQYIINEKDIVYNTGKGYSNYQEKIKSVIKHYKIPLKEIDFHYSNTLTKTNKRLWIITDYRNQIAHSDIKNNFSWKKSAREYIKVMELIRRLIFILIEPKFQKIPYPEDKF